MKRRTINLYHSPYGKQIKFKCSSNNVYLPLSLTECSESPTLINGNNNVTVKTHSEDEETAYSDAQQDINIGSEALPLKLQNITTISITNSIRSEDNSGPKTKTYEEDCDPLSNFIMLRSKKVAASCQTNNNEENQISASKLQQPRTTPPHF